MQKYQPKLKTTHFVILGVELRMSRNQFFNIFTSHIYSKAQMIQNGPQNSKKIELFSLDDAIVTYLRTQFY